MSEPIKIGIFVSIGLLIAIIATWDLLFGDRYGSTTYRHTSYTGQNTTQYSNETSTVSDETSDDTEDDSTQTKRDSSSSTSYSYAAPNYSQTVNTSAEPVTQDSPLTGTQQSENKDNARSPDSTQTLAVSSQSDNVQSTQSNQTTGNKPTFNKIKVNKIPSDKVETDAQDTAVRDELTQEDPDREIARNSVQRLERSLQRSQNNLDAQPESVATQTKNQATGKTSAAGLTKVLNATETTREPNTDRALSISYQFDSEVMCAPPADQVTKIDVLYRKNSYSIKGLSLYDIDRLVQLYRVCGGTLSITKNELPHAELDTDLYTRRQNEVKYLLTQLRVKKGDMVFSDSETTDQ